MITIKIRIIGIISCVCFSTIFAGNPDSCKAKSTNDLIKTLHHGIELKNQRYSETYKSLDKEKQRMIFERYNDFVFDSLYPTFSMGVDSLCARFSPDLAQELLLYIQKTNPFSDEFFHLALARLYLCRPDDFERSIKRFDLQSQKQLVDCLHGGWNRLKQESQQKLDKIDSLSIKLNEFYKGIMK